MAEQADDAERIAERDLGGAHGAFEVRAHDLAHLLLLVDQRAGGVDADEAELVDQVVVLAADETLELAKGGVGVRAETEVLAGFVELDLGSADQDASDGLVERDVEIEGDGGRHGERVQRGAASRG